MTLPLTFTAAFQATVAAHPHNLALSDPDGTVRLTWRQYDKRVRRIAAGLASLGVARGDTVGIMLTNRPEFHLVDVAALHTGATPFSIYNTLAPEQIAHLFGNAGNRVVVCEKQFLDQIRAAAAAGETAVEHIVCVDDDVEDTISLAELETRDGRRLRLRGVLARGRAHRRPDHHLHVGHHRTAEGRRAHPRQPAGRDRRDDQGGTDRRRRQDHLLPAGRAHREPVGRALLEHRVGHAPGRAGRHEADDLGAAVGAPDVLRGRAPGLVQAQGRHRGPARGRDVAGEEEARDVGLRRRQEACPPAQRPAAGPPFAGRAARRGREAGVLDHPGQARPGPGEVRRHRRRRDRPRGARVRARARPAVLRGLGHVRAVVRGHGQPARRDPDRHRRQGAATTPSCASPTTASCWCAARW